MADNKLLVATKNHGKIVEFEELLQNFGLSFIGLDQFPDIGDVAETGQSFAENALIKARYYNQNTGMLTVSDDSGLVVDALDGAPGIYSARYAGENASDRQRYEKLLDQMKDIASPDRTAHFVCAIALVGELADQSVEEIFTAKVDGEILFAPQGENGFGYDPIFFYPPLSKTFAQLDRGEKSCLSHRGRALVQVQEYLSRYIRKTF